MVNLFDSLIFPSHMIEKYEEILALFGTISGNRMFTNNINYIYHFSQATIYPFWFRSTEPSSLAEWVVANYESNIIGW